MKNVLKSLQGWFNANQTYVGAAVMGLAGIFGYNPAAVGVHLASWYNIIAVVLGGALALRGVNQTADANAVVVKKVKAAAKVAKASKKK